jgi:hypothetical protein
MTAYTSAAAITSHLGLTTPLTAEQAARAEVVATAITAWIDQRTGRSWQSSGSVDGEVCTIIGDRVYLARCPVVSVELVSLHSGYAAGDWEPLDESAYELFDAAAGVLLLPCYYSGASARVDYTSATAAPPDISAAADVLAADLLFTTLHPESAGVESISVAQNDISVRYSGAGGTQSAGVALALAIIDARRLPVIA